MYLGLAGSLAADEIEDRLAQAIQTAVCTHNGFSPGQVEINIHSRQLPSQCQDARSIRIQVPSHDDAIGPVTVRATFADASGEVITLPVPIRVRIFDDVLITRRRLQRRETITASDLQTQWVEITRLAPWVITDPDSVIGMWPKRTINPGRIVDRRWLVPVPLVCRGDRVTVAYETGAVRISTTAIAMEDGHRDQKIRVKRDDGNRLLSAIVIDEKTVRPTAH
jgi:flagella basal body P-ring formation protein FlgA